MWYIICTDRITHTIHMLIFLFLHKLFLLLFLFILILRTKINLT